MSNFYERAANKLFSYNSPYNQQMPQAPQPYQKPPSKNTMIQRIKSSIQTFIPSSIKSQVNSFFDLLDITLQIDNQNEDSNNSTTIAQIQMLLEDISEYIKRKVNGMQLTGLAQNFFSSLAAFIVMFAYIFGAGGVANGKGNVIYHGDGGRFKRTKKHRKHKQSRRR